MPKKLKKKAKKGNKKKSETEPEEPTYEVPEFFPSRIDAQPVVARIRIAAPPCPALEFTAQLSPSTLISEIATLIKRKHGNAVRRVNVCVNRFHPDEVADPRLSLKELGVSSGECLVYYDFVPITDPLIQ